MNTNRYFQAVVSNQIDVIQMQMRGTEEAGKAESWKKAAVWQAPLR